MHSAAISASLSFSEASGLYLKLRKIDSLPANSSARYLSERTLRDYEQYRTSLNLFFGSLPLNSIHTGNISAYQIARLNGEAPWFIRRRRPHEEPKSCPAGPKKIGQELVFLKMVMQRAGAWTEELQRQHKFEKLRYDEPDVPLALDPDQQAVWLEVSRLKKDWELVHWYSVMAINCCTNPKELLTAKLGNLNMFHQVLTVSGRSAKNRYRIRTIPLVDPNVQWAAEKLIDRAKQCGCTDPQHFLFPFRDRSGPHDPFHHATESLLKTPWEEVQQATGLTWFTPRLCRHTGITRLAEAGVAIDVIMSMAGHVTERMRQHYIRISEQAKVKALHAAMGARQPKKPPIVQPDWRGMKVATGWMM